jgi:predicted nucleotidyltransferase
MYSSLEIENKLRELKPDLVKKYAVSRIGYFGSFAKENQNEESDLDLLVEFSENPGWKFFTLENHLAKNLGLKVDLVTPGALKDQIKASILKQVKYI